MSLLIVNQAINDTFYHGDTGLVDGDFTKSLYLNGASDSATVTITELSGGFYKVNFTPDAEGLYFLRVSKTASPNNPSEGLYEISDDLMTTRKYVRNKFVLNKTLNTYEIFEDDGSTSFATGASEETATEITRTPD